MRSANPPLLDELITLLAKLPGLGRKSASRLALYFLRQPEASVRELADKLVAVKERIKFCSICHNFTDDDPCPRCTDPRRDRATVCVVETPADLLALDSSGLYNGLYHVLGGALAPLSGIGPDDLKIAELLERVDTTLDENGEREIREVVLATGSSPEGETTAAYLAGKLRERGLTVTRLARGIPMGADLEYVDAATLRQSLENRREA